MSGELTVLLAGDVAGTVRQEAGGALRFVYDEAWRDRADAYPLSLSMPLPDREHGDEVVRPFLEGLLPDNADVLARWGRRLHVSPRNAFGLLSHMGEDCAGAVQFVRPDRLAALRAGGEEEVEWLTEDEIGARLRDLVEHHGIGRAPGDPGYFSLAGAQPKTVLVRDGDRWGVPGGAVPSTHILKPPALDLAGFAVNEHLCLMLADELGLPAPRSRVIVFDGEPAVVVERYDRASSEGRVVRLHQEDFCQALGVGPDRRYEAEGGPGAPDCVRLLLDQSTDPDADVASFVDALALNWAIAGTDAHAKNVSLLLGPGRVRLAPLYDIVSILPYPKWVHPRKAKLAMRIGREYHVWKIGRSDWEEFARRCGLDPEPVVGRVAAVLEQMPEAVERAAAQVREEGLTHPIVDKMETEVRRHAAVCLRRLHATPA